MIGGSGKVLMRRAVRSVGVLEGSSAIRLYSSAISVGLCEVADEMIGFRGGSSSSRKGLEEARKALEGGIEGARLSGRVSDPTADILSSRARLVAEDILRAHPVPSEPIAAHDPLDLTRSAHLTNRSTPLGAYTPGELVHAVRVISSAGVNTGDLFGELSNELSERLSELEAPALVEVCEAFASRPGGVSPGFWTAVATHVASRSGELTPRALSALVSWLLENGADCTKLAREAAAKFAYTLSDPTWAHDVLFRDDFATFLSRASSANALSKAFLGFVDTDLADKGAVYYSDEALRSVEATLQTANALSNNAKQALQAARARRAYIVAAKEQQQLRN